MRAFPLLSVLTMAASMPLAPLAAQVELEAFGGVLAPTSSFTVPSTEPSFPFGSVEAKFSTSFTYGVAGRFWVAPRLGLEATAGFASGSLVVQQVAAPDTSYPSSSTAITLVFLYRLSTPSLPNPVWLSAGPAWMSQDVSDYDGVGGSSSLGLVFGAGSSLALNDQWRVGLALDLFLYSFDVDASDEAAGGETQFDFRARAGIGYHFGRDPD